LFFLSDLALASETTLIAYDYIAVKSNIELPRLDKAGEFLKNARADGMPIKAGLTDQGEIKQTFTALS
jgi:hypothetical protein